MFKGVSNKLKATKEKKKKLSAKEKKIILVRFI